MKTLFLLLSMTFLSFAEEKTKSFLLEYTTQDYCRSCTFVYAIACSPGTNNCGTPVVSESHFKGFDTAEEAIKFVSELEDYSANLFNRQRTFVRLLAVKELKVTVTEKQVSRPQPPLVDTVLTYEIKK
jgi:hypothetical protein